MTVTPSGFGSWRSAITTHLITMGQVSLSEPRFGNDRLYWLEGRPEAGGRISIACQAGDGSILERVAEPYNVRTRVHEYGGGAWAVHGETVFFSDFRTGRLYRQDPEQAAFAITPAYPQAVSVRYADLEVTPDGQWIVCVRETHRSGDVTNDLALVSADGSAEPSHLVAGHDFFSFPRVSPDGQQLLWTSWDHPRMPWEGTDLWVADLSLPRISRARHVAGGPRESVFQPEWASGSRIYFVSDRSDWWNLYAWSEDRIDPILPMAAEFGVPQWVFGMSRYVVLDETRLVAIRSRMGEEQVLIVDAVKGEARSWRLPYTAITSIASNSEGRVAVLGASPSTPTEISLGIPGEDGPTVVRRSFDLEVSAEEISQPEHIEFPTGSGKGRTGAGTAFAFFYRPKNARHVPLDGELPPLIVTSHGGPTAAAGSGINLSIQFWTTRGFAVVDVNYRGSSGYGRPYRDSLNGEWGVADVEDCISAARYLAESGMVDSERMVVRGKSASGLTMLGALVFHRVFAAGAGYYSVADLEGLVADTHKFESRYLDSLIGPYPEAADRYRDRSPLVQADRLSAPLILFQGLEDRVVPPSQAEVLTNVLREKGLPFAYLTFEGEQHGFRQPDSIRRSLDAELYFYSRILGFEPAGVLEPVSIENSQGIRRRDSNT